MSYELLKLIRRQSREINLATNELQGSPYWNIYKKIVKIYLKKNSIKEISIPDFSNLTLLNKKNSKKILIEINSSIFRGQK